MGGDTHYCRVKPALCNLGDTPFHFPCRGSKYPILQRIGPTYVPLFFTMELPFKRFIVWQCPKGGFWQGRENGKWRRNMDQNEKYEALLKLTLKCKRCNKSTKFLKERVAGPTVKHRWSDNAKEIEILVKEMNKRSAET